MQPTGTNRSKSVAPAAPPRGAEPRRRAAANARPPDTPTPATRKSLAQKSDIQKSDIRNQKSQSAAPGSQRGPRQPGGHSEGHNTRSHPELGRENPLRRWYCVSRRGRAGRRQAPPDPAPDARYQKPEDRNQKSDIRSQGAAFSRPTPPAARSAPTQLHQRGVEQPAIRGSSPRTSGS